MIGPAGFPVDPEGGSAAGPEEWLRRRLFERRMVILTGPLDDVRAGRSERA